MYPISRQRKARNDALFLLPPRFLPPPLPSSSLLSFLLPLSLPLLVLAFSKYLLPPHHARGDIKIKQNSHISKHSTKP